jgi:isoleucyl-tRNA synthetase
MTPQYESRVIENFYAFFEKDMVYKGLKPVYWCIHDETALAEAEVEYANHTSPSIWVRYALTSDPAALDPALAGKKVATIIWTTTPWTLPASMAVAFNPREEYVAIASGEWVYIVARKLVEETARNCELDASPLESDARRRETRVLATLPGSKLERATFAHPFLERSILGVLADYVTMDQGTGAVHTAPSHGADDFYTGVEYGIDQTCNVDESGRLRNGLPEYDGMTVFKANEPVIELLKKRRVLLHRENIEHSYPHCWRCHNPVIFRATEQWFIAMEGKLDGSGAAEPGTGGTSPSGPQRAGGTLRSVALDEIAKVKWDPAWGEERISNMIATRPDWCISRQRVWGVPIAVFFCSGCGEVLKSKAANRAVIELFAREGADAWYRRQPAEILPAGTKCANCGGTSFRQEMDIIDVWFESGSSQAAVLGHSPEMPWPADLYLEGGDQHRGWFHSSLLCAIGLHGGAPYRGVVTNGWTLDEEGRAMSKSLGNVVDPVKICKELGAEVVRLWVASVDFREDVRASENLMQRVAENYRKIRNTFRYLLSNLHGFDPLRDLVPFDQMEPLDQFLLLRTAEFAGELREWYQQMQFHRIYQRLVQFCAVDLSALYMAILKDRLYTFPRSSRQRRSAQTAMWRIAEALTRLVAPIMSFIADEVWRFLPALRSRPESVHMALFPTDHDVTGEIKDRDRAARTRADWEALLAVREEVNKAIEAARNAKVINSELEAEVVISAPAQALQLLERNRAHLNALFVVSSVVLQPVVPAATGQARGEPGDSAKTASAGDPTDGLRVEARHAPGQKCERCWNYSTHVGENRSYPTVCERCSAALSVIERERAQEGAGAAP